MAEKRFQVLYDYEDVPTLKKFALSNKRVRMAMGPFGCLSNDTEYLGLTGWKRISDYSDDQIAQYSLETGEIEFAKPDEYIVAPCAQFYHFKGLGVDMMLSEEHRILLRAADGMETSSAREVAFDHWGAPLGDEIPNTFKKADLAQDVFSDEATLRLQVAVIAEGSFHKSKAVDSRYCSMGFVKQRKKERIEFLLNLSGTEFKKTEYENGKTYYYFQAPIKTKKFNGLFWMATNREIKIILNELRQWDFHYSNGNTFQYSTTEKESADFIQYCFATQGIAVNVTERDRGGVRKPLYRLNVNPANRKNVLYQSPDAVSLVNYGNGLKYCFKTKTGFFVARRNGKIFITGNSGKSSACVMEIIRRAHEQKAGPDGIRRSRWAVVRNSYGQLKDTTIKTFHDWFPPLLFGEYRVTDHMYIITKFPGVYLEVLFRALDRPDQVSNLLSLELTGAWFNEVREIPRTIIEAMDGRIGRYPSGRDGGASWYGIIMDTNPPDEDSYLYKMFERVRPDNWEIFKQPSGLSTHAENTKHLPKNYYQNLVKGKDEIYKRIYVDGQYGFLVTGKPVFQSFVDNVHVARKIMEPEKGLDVIVGFDFGLSPACVIGQITPLGQLIIYDELVSDGMGLRQFCENQLLPLLRRKYFGMRVMGFGDPSGTSRAPTDESTCFEILQGPDVGLREILPATTNAILARIGAVESFLNKMYKGEPGFILSPNCHFLRKAFNGGYHYEKIPKSVSGDEYKPMPAKNFSSHISDALQYLCLYIDEKSNNDKLWKSFSSRMKRVPYRPAVNVAGY